MQGKIEQVTVSKTGKSLRVRMGTEWYGARLPMKGTLEAAVGKTVEADIKDSGDYGEWIEGITVLTSIPTPDKMPSNDRWWMNFVSNTVAHAITAGCINEPGSIAVWAKAAKQAAEEL